MVAASTAVASAAALGSVSCLERGRGIEISARVELDPDRAGSFRVRARVTGRVEGDLGLRGVLGDSVLGLSGFVAARADGAPIAWSARRAEGRAHDEIARTTYVLELPAGAVDAAIEYSVRPARGSPPTGEPELRRVGWVDSRGCAVSLASLLLAPEDRPARVRFELGLPENWHVVRRPPAALTSGAAEELLLHGLVAHAAPPPVARGETRRGSVELVAIHGSPPGAEDAVRRIAAEAERLLGRPRTSIEVLLLPVPESGGAVDLPGRPPYLAVDLDPSDLGSVRRLVRALVPRWFDRELRELSASRAQNDWFLLGLCEYLSLRIPAEVGLAPHSWRQALESTLALEPALAEIDPRPVPDASPARAHARRIAAALAVHSLASSAGGLEALLEPLRSRGGPPRAPAAPDGGVPDPRAEIARLAAVLRGDWSLPLAPEVPPENAARDIAATAILSFTADLEGKLENCGCKMSQSGGLSRLASAIARLRRLGPPLFALDLGHFAAVELGEPEPDPLRALELEFLGRTMAALGYDAVAVGPDEMYAGHPALRANARAFGLPLCAAGLRVDGQPRFPASLSIERGGLTLGFVALSERIEFVSAREQFEGHARGVEYPADADEALAALRELRPRVDLLVVGGRMRPATLRALCESDVRIDVALVAGLRRHENLRGRAAGYLGQTLVAADQLGNTGLHELTLFLSADGRVVAHRLEARVLGKDAAEDREVAGRIDQFYADLDPALVLAAVPRPSAADPWQRDDYAGAGACQACHPAAYAQWSATPHARALESLAKVARDRRPACVACHVLGLGAETGFQFTRPDPRLAGVQCEACHGAGGEHVRSEGRQKLRRTPGPDVCLACHDAKHAENFEARVAEAMASVRHGGLDAAPALTR